MAKKGSEVVQVRLRMRRDQYQRLGREAKRRNQTINAEILTRLDRSFENEGLVSMMTAGIGENAWLLDLIARCLYVLRGWEQHSDEDRHRSLDAAVSLLIKGIRKFGITEADIGEVQDAAGRGRLLAYSIFNRTIGREKV
jgi:hypothetical protein